MNAKSTARLVVIFALGALGLAAIQVAGAGKLFDRHRPRLPFDDVVRDHVQEMMQEGRQTFRFDTFGDEDFWGGVLELHEAIQGEKFGGVGGGIGPGAALALGLKVDVDALPRNVQRAIEKGDVDLDDPGVTLALLKSDAVVGVKGFFTPDGTRLASVGIQCALCHSTVDNSLAPGIGHRLDGWANRDLDVGAIIASAPHLEPVATLLHTDVAGVKNVVTKWGPGKFDAELFLDGKGFQPDGRSAATLIPPAFGLPGVNLHTWTGWGSVTHWNAFVANLEMHGHGTFFDPRLDDANQFPIAAENHFGHVTSENDRISAKLPALHFYQLALPAPAPPSGSFNEEKAERGDELFSGKAKCATCHVEGPYSEPGWNMHRGEEIGIDDFQADRAPDHRYRTSPLKGLWTHTKGGFFHDGRFATLGDVVNHYDAFFQLALSDSEKTDLVEYLKSLGDDVAPSVKNARTLNAPGAEAIGLVGGMGAAPVEARLRVWPSPATRGGIVHLDVSVSTERPLPPDFRAAIYDVAGRRVAGLTSAGGSNPALASFTWDGRDAGGRRVGPGLYFARITSRSLALNESRRVLIE